MFLIHKQARGVVILAAALALGAIGGCASDQSAVVKTPVVLAPPPPADEAAEWRGWHRSVALYHSGAIQAWPTRWYYQPDPESSEPEQYLVDSFMFGFQTLSLPLTVAMEPPFMKVYYAGDVLPPTYTAMPPLPPAPLRGTALPDPDPLVAPAEPVAPPEKPLLPEVPPMILPEQTVPAHPSMRTSAPRKLPSAPPAAGSSGGNPRNESHE